MMFQSKIARPFDQTEKEWTNTDTMLTDDNDDHAKAVPSYRAWKATAPPP